MRTDQSVLFICASLTAKQRTLEECLQLLSTAFARGNLGGLFKGTEGLRAGIRETRAGIAHVRIKNANKNASEKK